MPTVIFSWTKCFPLPLGLLFFGFLLATPSPSFANGVCSSELSEPPTHHEQELIRASFQDKRFWNTRDVRLEKKVLTDFSWVVSRNLKNDNKKSFIEFLQIFNTVPNVSVLFNSHDLVETFIQEIKKEKLYEYENWHYEIDHLLTQFFDGVQPTPVLDDDALNEVKWAISELRNFSDHSPGALREAFFPILLYADRKVAEYFLSKAHVHNLSGLDARSRATSAAIILLRDEGNQGGPVQMIEISREYLAHQFEIYFGIDRP